MVPDFPQNVLPDYPSKGHTAILTLVDRFSKMARFISFLKLPSAKETAKLVLQHAFRLHGLSAEIVSSQGLQVTSIFSEVVL